MSAGTPGLALYRPVAPASIEPPTTAIYKPTLPLSIRELDTYLVFRSLSEIPPTAVQLPIEYERLIIIGSGQASLTVCNVDFDEAVLKIEGVGTATASGLPSAKGRCVVVKLEFTPQSYKCTMDRLTITDCIALEGCGELPWHGLVYVDTGGPWYAARSEPTYVIMGGGRAYVVADYICINGSGRVCKVEYPSECCEAYKARLILKRQGQIVAYSDFNITVCSFGG